MQLQVGKDRIEPRTRSAVRACLRDSQSERDICIMNISSRGLLATTARPPRRGEFVELIVGHNRLIGQVKWSSQRRFGMSLRERVSVTALLEGGSGPIALRRSAASRPARAGWLSSLRANPEVLSHFAQYAVMGFAVLSAAVLIASLAAEGFTPVQQAMTALAASEPG